jgi:hypothetical protein
MSQENELTNAQRLNILKKAIICYQFALYISHLNSGEKLLCSARHIQSDIFMMQHFHSYLCKSRTVLDQKIWGERGHALIIQWNTTVRYV